MNRLAFKLLFLSFVCLGCADMPRTLRNPTSSENRALSAAVQAWVAAGRDTPVCEAYYRAMVAPLDDAELQTRCYAEYTGVRVAACVYQVNRHVFDPSRTAIYFSNSLDMDGQARAIIHEALHAIKACVVRNPDYAHADTELWGPIMNDAFARWQSGT